MYNFPHTQRTRQKPELQQKTMGDRHNRKRTRHRPIRRQRLCCPQLDQQNTVTMIPSSPSPSDHQTPAHLACSCWHPSARQTPTTTTTTQPTMRLQTLQPSHCTANLESIGNSVPETPRSRTRRVFGGVDSSDDNGSDDEESTELCGSMLDIVLGLFGGVDYDYDDDHLR